MKRLHSILGFPPEVTRLCAGEIVKEKREAILTYLGRRSNSTFREFLLKDELADLEKGVHK